MITRRTVIEWLSIGGAASAAGCSQVSENDPTAPWRDPGAGERDPRRWALAHAILAPNPHNRQPWLIDLPGRDEIVLYADLDKLLPQIDPPNRQIVLGCGAFLELLVMAARQSGHRPEIALWPEGVPSPVLDSRPVARIRLVADPTVERDPLFAQITRRHTNRAPFDMAQTLAAADLAAVTAAVAGPGLTAGMITDPTRRGQLIALGWQAFEIEMNNPATHMETVRLMRIGADEVARNPDGIALTGASIEVMKRLGLISAKALADPQSNASKTGFDMWEKMLQATPAFLVIKSNDNSRVTQIGAGRAFARAQLAATARGLSMHPWSMSLQEFPQMASLYGETQALLEATPNAPVQMLVRVGRAKDASPAPRWPLVNHIRS